MRKTFSTTEYQAAHGKMPKGFGMWGFRPVGADADDLDAVFWFTGTFAQAKAAAPAGDWVVCS